MLTYLSSTPARALAPALAVACAVLLSGCASGNESSQSRETVTSVVTETPSQGAIPGKDTDQESSSQGEAHPDTSAACQTAGLSVTAGDTQGAAGSILLDVDFRNTSDNPCTLDGFPGVSLVGNNDGTQLGAPARREEISSEPVTLQPGESAHSPVRITRAENYDVQACSPVPADGLRVYPPNQTDSVFLPLDSVTGCESEDAELISVQPVIR
ncbi:DUF4232 domain-containing protein [Corynebacterium flavescens]|uniref:DUF4232 domain-containing protein n=1 Tax=Corynebacterium flavescens TaxID=28028 RepID=UPI003FD3A716